MCNEQNKTKTKNPAESCSSFDKENYKKAELKDNPPPLPWCVDCVCCWGARAGRGGGGGGWGISCTFSSSSTQIIWESSSLEHHLLPISQSNTGFTNLKCKYVRTSNQQASRYPPVYLTYHAATATQVSKKLNAIS